MEEEEEEEVEHDGPPAPRDEGQRRPHAGAEELREARRRGGRVHDVRVLLRASLAERWRLAPTDELPGELTPDLPLLSESGHAINKAVGDRRLQFALRAAQRSDQLRLGQYNVRGCVHCELPHRGYRPFIWDLLLRGYVDRGTAAELQRLLRGRARQRAVSSERPSERFATTRESSFVWTRRALVLERR